VTKDYATKEILYTEVVVSGEHDVAIWQGVIACGLVDGSCRRSLYTVIASTDSVQF
jgi:hypothetical protein